MRIGAVAAQAGVNAQTIRFYERRGLLRKPQRLASGYRDYPAETIRIVRLIKQLQELGFTLTEIEALLRLQAARKLALPELQAQLAAKLQTVEAQILSLHGLRDRLRELSLKLEAGESAAGNMFCV
ncbi:MAG: MerR family transcriptional regulator [Acidobacteria bacterium]|nr:MerR family transcriptional regulator [Acidobacteriota bacterium]MBI3427835.1 MerR family transcriptional regulator [Acidobacteriota bacterium]